MMLKQGDVAPGIELPTSDMTMLGLAEFKGKKNVALYFYPKDDTPGCIIEAVEFSDLMDEFTAADTVILGVSKDTCISHTSFRDKHGLVVQLLADVEGQVCEAYGVWQEKEKDGVKRMGLVRSTFVIDKQGIIRYALYNIHPKEHAAGVLELVRGM
jgi:peroxiredoxin Q/BCP